jgi:hypothetical protein
MPHPPELAGLEPPSGFIDVGGSIGSGFGGAIVSGTSSKSCR